MEAWEAEVRAIPAAQALSRLALRDGLPRLLDVVAGLMRQRPPGEVATGLGPIPDLHALERLGEGFNLRQVVTEYRLLRTCVLRLWTARGSAAPPHPEEERVFHEAMDEAVAASVSRYARARERTLQALDRISTAALGNADVASFLPRLLQVLRETVAAVDVAAVLLKEGDSLRVECAVGEGMTAGVHVPMGEGFAGTVAAIRQPLLVHEAAGDARVNEPSLRAAGLRALYGAPLVLDEELLGVALMGSRASSELSEEDLLLFRAMAARTTALLAQAQAHARERAARAEAEASLARLRDSEAGLRRWEQVFTRLGVGVAVVSSEDNVLRDVNPAFARMHGYTPEELKGRPLEETFAPEARGVLPRHVSAANSKPSHEYESLHLRKDGSRFPAFTHVTAFRDETGLVSQRVATVLDITQRRAVEADRQRLLSAIEGERARLASVLDQMPAGVFIAEAPSGRLLMASRHVEVLTGRPFRPAASLEDYSRDYTRALHPDGRSYATEEWPLTRSLRHGEVVQGEEQLILREDGQRITVLVSSTPIRDREGTIVAGVATMVDVTERRRAQEAALQAALFGERLIAIVSHDLRNPLNAIQLSATQLLHSEALPERERRLVTRLARSSDRMKRMISELLDFTRGRLGGGIPIQRVPGDLRTVVRQGVEELEAAWPERSVRLQVAAGRYDGEWDADRLLQVVSNVGGNALQYSAPDAPVTFNLSDAGEAVVLEVHNPGEPIPADVQPRLFDPFRRGAAASQGGGVGGGLGLGLYIVEQVVKGHGGRIEVTSTAETGTTFRVTLPRSVSPGPPRG
ncbi:sensor histidine kinase [Pyxidicoccus xibeiensis]|uniref:sensor histidine kinase n=1 Tax=Pyxidicoccus xibeiensis TaxID=2906759 RepID=UPI0020A709E7|nr:PAS domain S-box protein [Pyxidicoccus xibeiensis]MCP3139967.1 PAS domain S-box protein [Pyxidicoccus xibeiensis]